MQSIRGYEPHILFFLTVPFGLMLILGYMIVWIDITFGGLYSRYIDYKYRKNRKPDVPYKRVMYEISLRKN